MGVSMKGLLIRVGIDHSCGEWNGPYDPQSGHFVYVPIPDNLKRLHPHLIRSYDEVSSLLTHIGMNLPEHLKARPMHLDPDFEMLTYGDVWPRSAPLLKMGKDDFIVFYAGLRSMNKADRELVYAIIGFYRVSEVVHAIDIPENRWHENAHTRRKDYDSDIVVRAVKKRSGKLVKAIPIGEFRNKSYRVRQDLLEEWGGLSVKDGYLQRSARLPHFLSPERFMRWFEKHNPGLVAKNF